MLDIKWGLPKSTYRRLSRLHGRVFDPPFATDSPDRCILGAVHWHTYPICDYQYQYNSWGFRGDDYEQYRGQRIIACIGDSATINLGGPVEHSWPYHLSKYFDLPVLNFGIDALSYYDMHVIVDKVKSLFKVDKIFVLYNIFDADAQSFTKLVPAYSNFHTADRLSLFKKHCWIHDAVWQFDPPWTFGKEDLQVLYQHFPEAHDFLKGTNFVIPDHMLGFILSDVFLQTQYQEIKGPDWPMYHDFCQAMHKGLDLRDLFASGIDQDLILEFVRIHLFRRLMTNRDGWHLSDQANQLLAKYFYQMSRVQ
jgi:hypothetical protein